jgi:hypothetical protein
MRTALFCTLVAISACAQAPTDTSDQLDAPTGKEDGASKPSGAYTNPAISVGEIETLSLNANHTYTRTEMVECLASPCNPLAQSGRYLFTHSTTSKKTYIRFYAHDGSELDRYQWRIKSGHLELNYEGTDHWFSMNQGGTCQASGGTCVPLVPDACEFGSVGDATQYSCGGGLGVECCLPPVETGCHADTDCTGALPQFCRTCSDGSQACAHWSCASNSCPIVSCN